jgi:hypothetical protein
VGIVFAHAKVSEVLEVVVGLTTFSVLPSDVTLVADIEVIPFEVPEVGVLL